MMLWMTIFWVRINACYIKLMAFIVFNKFKSFECIRSRRNRRANTEHWCLEASQAGLKKWKGFRIRIFRTRRLRLLKFAGKLYYNYTTLPVIFQCLDTSVAVGTDAPKERTGAWKHSLRDFVLVYIFSPNVAKFVDMKIGEPLHYSFCKELPKNVIFMN